MLKEDDFKNDEIKGINVTDLNRHLNKFNRRVNDIYIDTLSITRLLHNALGKTESKLWNFKDKTNISVPSTGGTANIKRNSKQIKAIFENAEMYGQWEKSLIVTISLTEDFIASFIRLVLRSKPIMIMNSIKNQEGKLSVGLADIINKGSELIIEEQISGRVSNAIYASPREYGKYLEALLCCELGEDLLGSYIEIKARRDIIIHASGIVNRQYLDKAGKYGKDAKAGDVLKVHQAYYEESLRSIKRFSKSLHVHMLKKYGDDGDVRKVIDTKGF